MLDHRPVATALLAGACLVLGAAGEVRAQRSYDPDDPCTPGAQALVSRDSSQCGRWSAAGYLDTPRALFDAVALPGGELLALGGYLEELARDEGEPPSQHVLATVELGDQAGFHRHLAAARMAQGRSRAPVVVLPDGRVLLVGGTDVSGTALGTSEAFVPGTQDWEPPRALMTARSHHVAVLLVDGRVLAAGGVDAAGAIVASAEVLGAEGWVVAAPMSQARAGHAAARLPDGQVLVAGGFDAAELASTELFEPGEGTWRAGPELPEAVALARAVTLPDGRVMLVGGVSGGTSTAAVALFDPAAGSWEPAAPMGQARRQHTATALPDGRVVVIGGLADGPGGTRVVADAEVWVPGRDEWLPAGRPVTSRYDHAAVLLEDGSVLIVGGSAQVGPCGMVGSAERLSWGLGGPDGE